MYSLASRDRLATLGIDRWLLRSRTRPTASAAPAEPERAGSRPRPVRVRLASGQGDWLLLQDAPWDGRHDVLLADIQAAIDPARCRFGQWAHSDSAGVALDELASSGIHHLLVFGTPPEDVSHDALLVAPALDLLASSGPARRQLWQELTARLTR